MLTVIIDLILVAIIALCVWRGISKGLILSVAGLLAIIISFYGARAIANNYSDSFIDALTPFVGSVVDERITEESVAHADKENFTPQELSSIAQTVFVELGFDSDAASIKADDAVIGVESLNQDLGNSITNIYMETLAYVFTFAIAFILINIIFSVLLNFCNIVFKMPGLKLLNTIGGAVAGLIYGLLMVFVISWIMRFVGLIIPSESLSKTLLMSTFMDTNPVLSIMGF